MERGAKYHDFIELSEWWFNFSLSWATSNAANQVKPSEKKRVAAVDPIRSNLITHQCQTYIRWLRCFICNRYRKTDPSPLHYHNALAWFFLFVTAEPPTVVLYKGWTEDLVKNDPQTVVLFKDLGSMPKHPAVIQSNHPYAHPQHIYTSNVDVQCWVGWCRKRQAHDVG